MLSNSGQVKLIYPLHNSSFLSEFSQILLQNVYIDLIACTLLGMSDTLRKELVGTGVKVTNILPGVCKTQMFVRFVKQQGMKGEEVEELGRKLIQPEDVGQMVWEAVSKPER